MAQTMQERTLTAEDHKIIGQLLVETLAGEISQETWDATYKLGDPREIPQPYGHLIGYTQGYALDGKSLACELQDELRIIGMELTEPRREQPNALGIAWIIMYELLKDLLEGSDPDELVQGVDKDMLPELQQAPAWAQPLLQHAQNSPKEGKELNLELLDVLEDIIRKRREQLS